MKYRAPFPLKIRDKQTGMISTNGNDKGGELLGQERRRRWSTDQKPVMVRRSLEPRQSVFVVARRNGINANKSCCGAICTRTEACLESVLTFPSLIEKRRCAI